MAHQIDTRTIASWIEETAQAFSDRAEYAALMHLALYRALCKDLAQQTGTDHLRPLTEAPDVPRLAEIFASGTPVYAFQPAVDLRDDLYDVFTWIDGALFTKEAWLNHTDDRGRPCKLLKLGSISHAVRQARKEAASTPLPIPLRPEDVRSVHTFDDGACILELLTPRALQSEGLAPRHCLTQSWYADQLKFGHCAYFSYRSPSGKPRASFEVELCETGRPILRQCAGKLNRMPAPKYLANIQTFVIKRGWRIKWSGTITGLLEQDGQYYRLDQLPPNFRYRGDLNLTMAPITGLPSNLTVDGFLKLDTPMLKDIGAALTVGGDLIIEQAPALTTLPAGLRVGGDLTIAAPITALPDNLHIGGSLTLRSTAIKELPRNLTIAGDLILASNAILTLPSSLKVGRNIDMACTSLRSLPEGLTIPGDLILAANTLRRLPRHLVVAGNLHIANTQITRLPSCLTVGGHVILAGPKRHPPVWMAWKDLLRRSTRIHTATVAPPLNS